MSGILRPEPNKVLVAGDWHGDPAQAVEAVQTAFSQGCDWVVQCGDFGFWSFPHSLYLDALDAECERLGVNVGWVDGNHERFPLIHELVMTLPDGRYRAHRVRPHVYYLPRGYRWVWRGHRWLALGGAVSLDRDRRIDGVTWFAAEEITEQEAATIASGVGVDVMVCHDAPACTHPQFPATVWWPEAQLARANRHRARLQRVMDAVRPSLVMHGHLHLSYAEAVSRPWGRSLVIGLDHGRGAGDHAVVLDAATLQWRLPTAARRGSTC